MIKIFFLYLFITKPVIKNFVYTKINNNFIVETEKPFNKYNFTNNYYKYNLLNKLKDNNINIHTKINLINEHDKLFNKKMYKSNLFINLDI
jgi:hypothetical protein